MAIARGQIINMSVRLPSNGLEVKIVNLELNISKEMETGHILQIKLKKHITFTQENNKKWNGIEEGKLVCLLIQQGGDARQGTSQLSL